MVQSEALFVVLFVVATAVAIGARRLRVPYTVALVLAGLLLGTLRVFEPPHLTRELLFSMILPGLLFEAAFHVEFGEFAEDWPAIAALTIPGVAGTIALTTLILTPVVGTLELVNGFTWHHALVFGAVIAATDPIAVVALFKSLGAPRRLGLLVEGESLLNDGTSIVFFTLVLGVVAGQTTSIRAIALDFVTVVGAGCVIGAVVGLVVSHAIRGIDDPMIEITLTTIAAYGAFVAAEHVHYSGVIATVVAGMLCGNYGARTGMSPSTRVAVETFWDYVAFALNSIVFLLIGFEVHVGDLLASWAPIVAAYVAVTLGRAVVVLGVSGLLQLTRRPLSPAWSVVLMWGGLRGALSMVLALSLGAEFPHRDLLVTMTFGVVVLSILVQGLTMAPILRRLGLVGARAARLAYDRQRVALQAATVALAELETMARTRLISPEVLAAVRGEYEDRVERVEQGLRELRSQRGQLEAEEAIRARRRLLLVEKGQVLDAVRRGELDQASAEPLLADVDARLVRLEQGAGQAEEPGRDEERGRGRGRPGSPPER